MVKRGLIIGGLIPLLWSFSAFAEGADFSVDVSSVTLELTIPQNIELNLEPTSSVAVFGSEDLTFNVATNNPTGYKVVMSVPQTELAHSSISSANIPTLESNTTETDFPTNRWGYKTTGDYLPIKLSNENSAWQHDDPTNGTNHLLTLAVKVDSTQTAGLYTDTLTFYAVVNPNSPKQTVIFNGNGADDGEIDAISIFGGDSINLPKNTFTKTGYSFNGWNTIASGVGVGYGDEDVFTAPDLTSPSTITLYAQWQESQGSSSSGGGSGGVTGRTLQRAFEEAYLYNNGGLNGHRGMYVPEKDALGNFTGVYHEATSESEYQGIAARDLRYAIQDINLLVDGQNVCDRATVSGSEAVVLDLRDFKSYHIIRMRDGRCWMQDNIALDPSDSTTRTRMLAYNYTNAPDDAIDNYINGGNLNNQAGWSSRAAYYSADNSTGSIYSGDRDGEYISPRFNLDIANSVISAINGQTNDWKAGGLYNYCGASAGTYCYNDGNGDTVGAPDDTTSPIDSKYDICPSGWRMPTDYDSAFASSSVYQGEIMSLLNSYRISNNSSNDDQLIKDLFHPSMAGYLQSGLHEQGNRLDIWTSTWTTKMGMRTMHVYILGSGDNKRYGFNGSGSHRGMGYSVRCIARITDEQ